MKAGIHPNYQKITIACACGNSFEAGSTLTENLRVEICSNCHPLYTGKSKLIDTAGRVDKFRARMAAATPKATAPTAATTSTKKDDDAPVVEEAHVTTPVELADEESAMATEDMPAIEMAEENAATTETPHTDEDGTLPAAQAATEDESPEVPEEVVEAEAPAGTTEEQN